MEVGEKLKVIFLGTVMEVEVCSDKNIKELFFKNEDGEIIPIDLIDEILTN